MSTNKTQPTNQSVDDFLNRIEDENKRQEACSIYRLLDEACKRPASMWGDSIVGFGRYHYRYESGREGDFFRCGFSPRKQNFAIYIMGNTTGYDHLFQDLGKHKRGKSCLYINRLDQINVNILQEIVKASMEYMDKAYPAGT